MINNSPFDFIFIKESEIDKSQLSQGDLLKRTPALADSVRQAHSYYADADDYSHFLVVTQTCDLVQRENGFKSRYITLCAVRPLSVAVSRELAKFTTSVEGFPFPIGDQERAVLARQYLKRVLNNTIDGMFFIPKGSAHSVDEHLCAFLPLSIALRGSHYEVCLAAKIAQAEGIFAAKIGSLTSNLYGRIATPDLSEKHPDAAQTYQDEFFEELGYGRIAWLSRVQKKALKARVSESVKAGNGVAISEEDAESMLTELPNEATDFVNRAVDILVKRNLLASDERTIKQAIQFLLNDQAIKRLAKQ